jgi:CBS domain-containing protein
VRELGKRGVKCMEDTVAAMMTTKLKTCVRSDTADSVLAMMTEGRFRHMPVVENEALIGLISLGDVVKARLSEVSMEKDALEHMIMGH